MRSSRDNNNTNIYDGNSNKDNRGIDKDISNHNDDNKSINYNHNLTTEIRIRDEKEDDNKHYIKAIIRIKI